MLNLNTYGLRSINRETFNTRYHDNLYFPRQLRNVIVTALRIHNAVLNVLGYMARFSPISGCVRMATGLAIIGVTMSIGDRNATQGAIVGRWYDEAIRTGVAQVVRGAFEALIPFGWVANMILDVVATPINLSKEIEGSLACDGCMNGDDEHVRPHNDVDYLLPFEILHVV